MGEKWQYPVMKLSSETAPRATDEEERNSGQALDLSLGSSSPSDTKKEGTFGGGGFKEDTGILLQSVHYYLHALIRKILGTMANQYPPVMVKEQGNSPGTVATAGDARAPPVQCWPPLRVGRFGMRLGDGFLRRVCTPEASHVGSR
jgi:hypothetical protein